MLGLQLGYVFVLLKDAFYGLLVFYALAFALVSLGYAYQEIKKIASKRFKEDISQKGALVNKHVIITGGSSGIGKSLAILAAKHGANVSIIARNREKLETAREEIEQARRNKDFQRIECLSLDIGGDYNKVERAILDLENQQGPCYMLVTCAGKAIGGRIEDTTPETLKRLVDLNLNGSYYCTKAVTPGMKQRNEGKIVLVSSQAGMLGIYGLSAYCCTKYALRGLAESLSMELMPHNISVTLSLPPDTNTPGFEFEELTKPRETKLICESAGLFEPEVVAQTILKDAMNCKFTSIVGLESFILTTLCAGMSPYSSLSELLLQALLMGPLRIISAFYLCSFEGIIRKCMSERDKTKKSE